MSVDQATLQKHIEALVAAMKQIGDDARAMHDGDGEDAERARVGGAIATAIGIACQTFGVARVKTVLHDFVSGPVCEQFWALQSQLAESEKQPDAAPASPELSSSSP